MNKEQIWKRLARIQKAWEKANEAKNWELCQTFKRYYDTLWAGWNGQ